MSLELGNLTHETAARLEHAMPLQECRTKCVLGQMFHHIMGFNLIHRILGKWEISGVKYITRG
jgi:hypothetical protein